MEYNWKYVRDDCIFSLLIGTLMANAVAWITWFMSTNVEPEVFQVAVREVLLICGGFFFVGFQFHIQRRILRRHRTLPSAFWSIVTGSVLFAIPFIFTYYLV